MGNALGQTKSAARRNRAPRSHKARGHDQAILDLKIQRDKLKQYQKRLQAVLDREIEIAKQHLAQNDRRRALLALKKKKFQEQLLDKTDQQLLNLEQMVQSIEYALVEQKVLEGLKSGNEVLKQLNNEMRLEDVEKLMDDTADAIAYQKEVEEALGSKLTDEEQAEIEAELELLEKAATATELQLPEVPKTDITVPRTKEEKLETKPVSASTAQKNKAKPVLETA